MQAKSRKSPLQACLVACLLAGLTMFNLVYALNRSLPVNGVLGTLQLSGLPHIVIDNQVVTLAAGAQIRNQKNLIVQPSALPHGPDVKVLYKKDKQGQIEALWILTNEEFEHISATPSLHH